MSTTKIIQSVSIFGRGQFSQEATYKSAEYVAGTMTETALKLNDDTLVVTLDKTARAVIFWGKHLAQGTTDHYVVTASKMYINAQEVPLNPGFASFSGGKVTIKGNYILEELLVIPYVPGLDEIESLYKNKGALYDPREADSQWEQIRYVTDETGNLVTAVETVAGRHTVKTQKTVGDKTYATGFVSGINEENESDFAIMADYFRVFGSPSDTGDGQMVFGVDTVTKQAYFLASLMIKGLLQATEAEIAELTAGEIFAKFAQFNEADILNLLARTIDIAGQAGVTGEGQGASATRFWAGASRANKDSAPFRVTHDGKVIATDAEMKGKIEAEEGYFRGDITGASGEFGGTLKAKVITADMFKEIRNVLPYTGLDSLDASNPIDYYFYIPSETEKIVSIKLSARGLPFRSYSKGAKVAGEASSSGWTFGDVSTSTDGSHSHGVIEGWSSTGNAGDHYHTVNISNHYHDIPAHGHDNIPGIFLGPDPANVHLYCRNSDSWGSAISLGSNTNLASELDLTSRFSGTGWKAIRFTSSGLGRITWQLVVKVDLTA